MERIEEKRVDNEMQCEPKDEVKIKSVSCSVMSNSFVTLWAVAHQVPLSMGFSRQESWGGIPFPPPGDIPYPGI